RRQVLHRQEGNQGHARRLWRLTRRSPSIRYRFRQETCKMADPMKIRATAKDGAADVRVLMAHEMETGQRKDASGQVIPAWHITEVTASLNGKPVLRAHWGPAISKNPYLQFKVKDAKPGDKIAITWVDNKGDKRTDEATVS